MTTKSQTTPHSDYYELLTPNQRARLVHLLHQGNQQKIHAYRASTVLSRGNRKLPGSTMIFNLTPASDCPAAALDLCAVSQACYAKKAERLYPEVLPYRKRQRAYWDTFSHVTILKDFDAFIRTRKTKITALRFNEAGDFTDQRDVRKLNTIAEYLYRYHNIITYGYSARSDLDFSQADYLRVKGSNHDNGNHGKTIVIGKHDRAPKGFRRCPGSCKTCSMCLLANSINIAFPKH